MSVSTFYWCGVLAMLLAQPGPPFASGAAAIRALGWPLFVIFLLIDSLNGSDGS